ncbi:MAG: hypothetical protein ACXWDF_11230 [Aeromicrobium sp.]
MLKNDGKWGRSNVDFDGELVTRYSKHKGNFSWIDYGLSVLDREVVTRLPQGTASDLGDLYADLSAEGCLAGLEIHERFYEIGSPEGLDELERLLAPL